MCGIIWSCPLTKEGVLTMDRTEATTQIVIALIEKGSFPYASDEERVEAVCKAYANIYTTVKSCEQNRSNSNA